MSKQDQLDQILKVWLRGVGDNSALYDRIEALYAEEPMCTCGDNTPLCENCGQCKLVCCECAEPAQEPRPAALPAAEKGAENGER